MPFIPYILSFFFFNKQTVPLAEFNHYNIVLKKLQLFGQYIPYIQLLFPWLSPWIFLFRF